MELICKIPDELYKKWEQSKFTLDEAYQFVDCIMKGTPLSEHERLISADSLKQRIASVFPMVYGGVASEIDNMPTIIPATETKEPVRTMLDCYKCKNNKVDISCEKCHFEPATKEGEDYYRGAQEEY